jgi:hypothetical protein
MNKNLCKANSEEGENQELAWTSFFGEELVEVSSGKILYYALLCTAKSKGWEWQVLFATTCHTTGLFLGIP